MLLRISIFNVEGNAFNRSQFYDMALKNYSLMMAETYPYLADYQIDNGTVDMWI